MSKFNESYFLTKEEMQFYSEKLKEKGFRLPFISEKIFSSRKRSKNYTKDILERVLKGIMQITPEEVTQLNYYVNCEIISKSEYEELQKYKETYFKMKGILNEVNDE